jgi:hypothetical protein
MPGWWNLVDTTVLEAVAARRGSSSLPSGTNLCGYDGIGRHARLRF